MPVRILTRSASNPISQFPISSSRFSMASSTQLIEPRPRNPVPSNPHLKRLHHFRTIVLPFLLILAFTTLVLGAIYAFCVSKPHTNIASQLLADPSAEANDSLFGKRQSASNTLTPTTTTTTSDVPDRYDLPQTALMFYTVTAPVVAIMQLASELVVFHTTPKVLRVRGAYVALLTTSAFLIAGWVTTLAFWMRCELPSLATSGQEVCPVQVRGHFMYGIHEVSVARIAVGWVVVCIYMAHVALLVLGMRVSRRAWAVRGNGGHASPQEVEVVKAPVDASLRKEVHFVA